MPDVKSVFNPSEIEILRYIGDGSSAEVYFVRYQNNYYAVKKFLISKFACGDKINIPLQEKHSLIKLQPETQFTPLTSNFTISHPRDGVCFLKLLPKCCQSHIIKLHQTYKDEKYLYLLLEYFNGGELYEKIRLFGIQSSRTIIKILLQIATALLFVHSKHIIFRDLKCENVGLYLKKINNDSEVIIKIFDFGMSRDLELDERNAPFTNGSGVKSETKMLHYVGSANFQAPEVILNKNNDQKSDVFAFGCVMYQVATGFPPFVGTNFLATYYRIFHCDLDIACFINSRLKELILDCLARNPDNRPELIDVYARLKPLCSPETSCCFSAEPLLLSEFYPSKINKFIFTRARFYQNCLVELSLELPTSTLCNCHKCNTNEFYLHSAVDIADIPSSCIYFTSADLLYELFQTTSLVIETERNKLDYNKKNALLFQRVCLDAGSAVWNTVISRLINVMVEESVITADEQQTLTRLLDKDSFVTMKGSLNNVDIVHCFLVNYVRIVFGALQHYSVMGKINNEFYEKVSNWVLNDLNNQPD